MILLKKQFKDFKKEDHKNQYNYKEIKVKLL